MEYMIKFTTLYNLFIIKLFYVCVRIKMLFLVKSGVKQVDNLLSTLFCIYINDLAEPLKGKKIDVKVNGQNTCVLTCVDDIVY